MKVLGPVVRRSNGTGDDPLLQSEAYVMDFMSVLAERDGARTELRRLEVEQLRAFLRICQLTGRGWSPHQPQVASLAAEIGQALSLDSEHCRLIREATLLMDVGMLAFPLNTAPSPSVRTDSALASEQHTVVGAAMLSELSGPVFKVAAGVARHHHENFDGSGYPDGLSEDAIPLEARIVSVAAFYVEGREGDDSRAAMTHKEVCDALRAGSRVLFDPQVIGGLLKATCAHEDSYRKVTKRATRGSELVLALSSGD